MKLHYIALLLLILLSFSFLQSQDQSFTHNVIQFGLGYLTGHLVHEVGHQAAAYLWNVPIKWNVGPAPFFVMWQPVDLDYYSYNVQVVSSSSTPFSKLMDNKTVIFLNPYRLRERGIVAMGGFGAEVLSSEVILASSSLKDEEGNYNYYLLGWLTMTVVNPIIYTLWTNNNHTDDDYHMIGRSGASESLIKGFMLTHAAVTALRVFLKLKDTDRIQIGSTSTSLSIQISF